jgi:hypothetical protein
MRTHTSALLTAERVERILRDLSPDRTQGRYASYM